MAFSEKALAKDFGLEKLFFKKKKEKEEGGILAEKGKPEKEPSRSD